MSGREACPLKVSSGIARYPLRSAPSQMAAGQPAIHQPHDEKSLDFCNEPHLMVGGILGLPPDGLQPCVT